MGWTASAPHAASPAGAGWSSADEPVVAQIDAATPGQNGPVAGDPGRQHAIEHVDATGDRLDQISRGSHPHQVAGAVAGEDRGLHGYQAVGERLWFAEAESTDPESIERQPAKFLGALPTKIVVESALHDPEAQPAGGRAEREVIAVAEENLRAECSDFIRAERLDRRLRADRHERRGIDRAVGGRQAPSASPVLLGDQLKHGPPSPLWGGSGRGYDD